MFRSLTLASALLLGSFVIGDNFANAQTAAVSATAITVQITDLRNTKGQIMVWFWNSAEGFPTKGERAFKIITVNADTAVGGTLTTTLPVIPGTYAVSILHDENGNGKMDSNVLGIPKEGYGASNNPITHFHAPSFKQAKFSVPTFSQKVVVEMHY